MTLKSFWMNLPITDQEKSIHFFEEIGFKIDEPQNENLVRISLNDNTILLMNRDELFRTMERENTNSISNNLISMDVSTKDSVDYLADKVECNGGKVIIKPSIINGYYGCLFEDLEGNKFNVIAME